MQAQTFPKQGPKHLTKSGRTLRMVYKEPNNNLFILKVEKVVLLDWGSALG